MVIFMASLTMVLASAFHSTGHPVLKRHREGQTVSNRDQWHHYSHSSSPLLHASTKAVSAGRTEGLLASMRGEATSRRRRHFV